MPAGGRPTSNARKVCLREVNAHLLCVLCGGYYIDAVTIGECLHSFCRSCIVKYLKTNGFCPICDVQLHKSRPLLSIRTDRILQRLVYKMVPGLYSKEIQRRKSFYSNTEIQSSTDSDSCDSAQDYKLGQEYFSPEDSISLSLEYYESSTSRDTESGANTAGEGKDKQAPHKRFLQCPAAVTMNHLKKFLSMKYGLTRDQTVDIIYEDECLPENFSLMDVAYTFTWKRVTPMRFYYRILERSTISTSAINHRITAPAHATTCDGSTPTTDSEVVTETDEVQKTGQGEQISDKTVHEKRKLDNKSEENNVAEAADAEPPVKKAREETEDINECKISEIIDNDSQEKSNKSDLKESTVNTVEEKLLAEANCSEEIFTEQNVIGEDEAVKNGDGETNGNDEADQQSQNGVIELNDNECETNVVEAETERSPSDDFILQEDQQLDINDDLEEDDDEDRLRICEEDLSAEDKVIEEDQAEENSPVQEVEDEKALKEKVEDVSKHSEFKVRKKNKKAKHHHHHRHKRDHPPPPAATILHSNDSKKDLMKLKVKLTAIKQDENAKHYYIDNNYSPRHSSKHKSYVVCDDNDTNSNPSQDNNDDDSRNSQMTDERDADVQSVASSKGHSSEDNTQDTKTNSNQNGSVEGGKSKSRESSTNKERLLQMRAVRHKSVSKHKDTSTNNNGTSKTQQQIKLIPPSSITVSKITAAEKRKMDEEKLLMLSGKNNNHENDNKRPSLEIMLVNAPNPVLKNSEVKLSDCKTNEKVMNNNNILNRLPTIPLVRIMKTTAPAPPPQQRPPTSTMASSKVASNNKPASKSNDNKQKPQEPEIKSSMDKLQAFAQSSEKRSSKQDDFGALDLSGKSSRNTFSPTSASQNVLNMAQSLVSRQFSNANSSPVRRASSNSPDVSGARASPDPSRAMIPASMWNLMTLSDTAVHIRNMKAVQDGSKPHVTLTNSLKKNITNHYPLAASPSRPSNSPPTQLKIPIPNLTLNNKNLLKTRALGNEIASSGRGRGVGVQNRNLAALKPGVNHDSAKTVRPMSPGRSAPGVMNRQSPSSAVVKKQAGINGRNLGIPPPPPAIPISSIFKMENMARKYDIEKVAAGLTVKAAVDSYKGIK